MKRDMKAIKARLLLAMLNVGQNGIKIAKGRYRRSSVECCPITALVGPDNVTVGLLSEREEQEVVATASKKLKTSKANVSDFVCGFDGGTPDSGDLKNPWYKLGQELRRDLKLV